MSHQDNTSSDSGGATPQGRLVEVEVLTPEEYRGGGRKSGKRAQSQRPAAAGKWVYTTDASGCLPAFVTCGLFLACLAQYGLLAAIGFAVFHVVGSIIGSVRQARQLIQGRPYNIWLWRTGNWLVSYILTVWLAAGR